MKKFDVHRWWIPGKSMAGTFVPIGIWTFIYLVSSMNLYSLRFSIAFRSLGWGPGTSTYSPDAIIDPSIKMRPFSEVVKGCFAGYWWVILLCILYILNSYLWLKRDKSLYIMKRLPASETFRRCALLLLVYALAVLILSLIIIMLYRLQYVNKVPPQCMLQESPLKAFSAFYPRGYISLLREVR